MHFCSYIGIDPGVTGALACITTDGVISIYDTPSVEVKKGKKIRTVYDVNGMVALLKKFDPAFVVLEEINPMPMSSALSQASLHKGFAYWHGICIALGLPVEIVKPQIWKAAILSGRLPKGKNADKDLIRLAACELFPCVQHRLSRKLDHDRAEALFLALHSQRTWGANHVGKAGTYRSSGFED